MNLTDVLSQMGGLQTMARELGVSEQQAATGAQALFPAILGGFKKQAQTQPAGLAGLGGMLEQLGGGGLLDDVLASHPTPIDRGNNVLGQIFGSKDVSRAVAQNAATSTGLDPNMLKKMLPMLAMVAAGLMARHASAQPAAAAQPAGTGGGGGLGALLGGLLGGGGASALAAGGGGAGGLGGLASMLDMDGDGNPLDDIMKLAGRGQ